MEYDLDDKPEVGDAAVFGCCCIRMLLYSDAAVSPPMHSSIYLLVHSHPTLLSPHVLLRVAPYYG
jgi:hypothetical protein